jgi:Fe-S cluster assembly iron-binding protein IscA
MVKLEPDAAQAIRSFLTEKGFNRPLRIDLHSSGCCDPALGLSVDCVRESDLVEELDDLTFVISPAIHELVGEVTISYVDDAGTKGFVLTSVKPVSEWDGVGVGDIKL